MILSKFFKAVAAQFNKLGNWLFNKDPIAQMQYEYDKAVEQLKEGREGLEQYRGLVEGARRTFEQRLGWDVVGRQIADVLREVG